jgi:hypothetical protein
LAVKFEIKNFLFSPENFIGIPTGLIGDHPFYADIVSFVSPEPEGIGIEVLSVITKVGGHEIACFLQHDFEKWILPPMIRTRYLADTRSGIEGDKPEHDASA